MSYKFRRFLELVLIPLSMIAAAILVENIFIFLVAVALVVFLAFNWSVHLFQRRLKKLADADPAYHDLETLEQDVANSGTRAYISTAAAIAGTFVLLRAFLLIDPIPRWVFLVVIAYVMSVSSVPAIDWLVRWRPVWTDLLRRSRRRRDS